MAKKSQTIPVSSVLDTLLSFGKKLPLIWPDILILVQTIRSIMGKLRDEVPTLEARTTLTAKEEKKFDEVYALMQSAGARGKEEKALLGGGLMAVIQFLAQNPWIVDILKTWAKL